MFPHAPARALGIALALGAASPACRKNPWPQTPEAAIDALSAAVAKGDAGGLYHALDEPTRWSIATLLRDHTEAVRLIRTKFPEAARAEALARFIDASDEPTFTATLAARRGLLGALKARPPTLAEVRCDAWKRCGYGGLAAPLGELAEATTHHLATTRDSASAYEQAGRR
jgi:hypothetical protein